MFAHYQNLIRWMNEFFAQVFWWFFLLKCYVVKLVTFNFSDAVCTLLWNAIFPKGSKPLLTGNPKYTNRPLDYKCIWGGVFAQNEAGTKFDFCSCWGNFSAGTAIGSNCNKRAILWSLSVGDTQSWKNKKITSIWILTIKLLKVQMLSKIARSGW